MIAIAAFLIGVTIQTARPPAENTFKGQTNGHTYSVYLRKAPFQARDRKIIWFEVPVSVRGEKTVPSCLPGFVTNSGVRKQFWGWDTTGQDETAKHSAANALIERQDEELIVLQIKVDGKLWPVSPVLYRDLLSPSFQDHNISARLSKDGRTLTFSMDGSDGGGTYKAKWIFRASGKHSRVVTQEC